MRFSRRSPSGLYLPEARGFRGPVGAVSGQRGSVSGRAIVFPQSGPVIAALNPSFGTEAGGEVLTVSGSGFVRGDVIILDDAAQTTTFVDSGRLTCEAPAHSPGTVVVLVRRGGTDSNTVSYVFTEEGGLPGDALVRSNWSTALGTTAAALRDTDKPIPWDSIHGNGVMEIISASGLGFPASIDNVARYTTQWNGTGSAGRWVRFTDHWAVPEIGESLYYRWYCRAALPDGVSSGTAHWLQDGFSTGDTNFEWGILNYGVAGSWKMWFPFNATAFPNNRFATEGLLKSMTYRVELQIHRIGLTTFNAHVRVYDSTGVLVRSDSDFLAGNGLGPTTLADNPTLTFRNVANITDFSFGTNGAFQGSVAGDHPVVSWYGSGLLIRTEDWCGPYSSAEND